MIASLWPLVFTFAFLGSAFATPSHQHPFLSSGPGADKIFTPDLVKFVQSLVDEHKVPGLTIGIVKADGGTEYEAWGRKTEDGDAMTADTLVDIGSCSKAFLTAAFGILIDDYAHGRNTTPLPVGVKKLDWDTKVKSILPDDWKLADPWATDLADFVDIFSHVSGLPRHDFAYKATDTPLDALRRLQHLRPAFELRQTWSYNNMMFMVGAHIISTYTGSFTQFVEDRIFKPLNMTSTTYSTTNALKSGKATQSWTEDGRRIPWWFTKDNTADLSAGAGGIISSVEDMTKWIGMLLNSGVEPTTNATVIPQSALDKVTTVNAIVQGTASPPDLGISGYGLGWLRTTYAGHDIISHNGGLPGANAYVLWAPSDKVGVVALANADGKYLAETSAGLAILRKLLGLPAAVLPFNVNTEHNARRPLTAPTDCGVMSDLPPYDYTGVYHDEGYGTVVICNASSTSHHCSQVLSAFGSIGAVDSSPGRPAQLFAAFPAVWASHIRLTHVQDTRFVLEATYIFPEGYGRNTTPFGTILGDPGETGFFTFVVENDTVVGMGLSGTVDVPTKREKEGGTVQHTSDAWLEKLPTAASQSYGIASHTPS